MILSASFANTRVIAVDMKRQPVWQWRADRPAHPALDTAAHNDGVPLRKWLERLRPAQQATADRAWRATFYSSASIDAVCVRVCQVTSITFAVDSARSHSVCCGCGEALSAAMAWLASRTSERPARSASQSPRRPPSSPTRGCHRRRKPSEVGISGASRGTAWRATPTERTPVPHRLAGQHGNAVTPLPAGPFADSPRQHCVHLWRCTGRRVRNGTCDL